MDAVQGGAVRGDALQEGALQGDAVRGGVLQGGVLQGGVLQGGVLQGGAAAFGSLASGETNPSEERSSGIALSEETLVGKELDRARKNAPKADEKADGRTDDGIGIRRQGFWRRVGQRLCVATGWSYGRRFLATLSLKGPVALWKRTRTRLADNLAREEEVQENFQKLLRLWGIHEDEIDQHQAMRTREAVGTGFLTLVSAAFLAANLLNPPHSALVRPLALFAAASFLLASLLMCLAALWRARVLKLRRFVPFTSWLCSPLVRLSGHGEQGRPGRDAEQGAGNPRPAPGNRDEGERAAAIDAVKTDFVTKDAVEKDAVEKDAVEKDAVPNAPRSAGVHETDSSILSTRASASGMQRRARR